MGGMNEVGSSPCAFPLGADIIPPIAPNRRKPRGKTLARRRGQNGSIERKGAHWYVRFWADRIGTDKRKHPCVYLGPATGPNKLNKSQRQLLAKQKIESARVNSAELFQEIQAINHGTRFRQQAEAWLVQLRKRKRRPVKERTIKNWKSHLVYINSKIGDVPLALVNNSCLRDFVAIMAEEKLPAKDAEEAQLRFSAKTVQNYAAAIMAVVDSALDANGDPLYPRKWNREFIDLPTIGKQHKPIFAGEEITKIVAEAEGQMAVFYATLAGSGVRVGELIGLEVRHVQDNVLVIEQQLWKGKPEAVKTRAGNREVDLDPNLGKMLHQHIGDRREGFLFLNENGQPLNQRNVLGRSLHPILNKLGIARQGFHGFRRHRVTHLRSQRVPDNLVRFWIGHSSKSITDDYDAVKRETEFRRFTAAAAGLGFELPGSKSVESSGVLYPNSGFVPSSGKHATSLATA